MNIWAIADLHLCFGSPDKTMEVFGPQWHSYTDKIQQNWHNTVHTDDLVLIAGDISWALTIEQVKKDLEWIDKLPGKKIIIKGNHDYWWTSYNKVQKILPSSITALQNNALLYNGIAIGGARLWDSAEYNFDQYINFVKNPLENTKEKNIQKELQEKIFQKELHRLRLSLSQMSEKAYLRIAMTHYPPISADLSSSQAAEILEEYNIDICVFGHLHAIKENVSFFGKKRNTQYFLTSCDYLQFMPLQVV